MAIEVAQINGDTVELLFDPDEDDLYVGENLSVVERHEDRGLIVQIVELRAIAAARGTAPLNRAERQPSEAPSPAAAPARSRSSSRRRPYPPVRAAPCWHLAIAKIRKKADPSWQPWDGWIPMRNVMVQRTTDQEMLRQCVPAAGNPIRLGRTLAGEDFCIEEALLAKINLIAGAQGAETARLAQLIVAALISRGVPCVVFDTKGAYHQLLTECPEASAQSPHRSPLIHLVPGVNLQLGVQHFGAAAFIALLTGFGLPTAAAMYFESHVARQIQRVREQQNPDQPPAFLGMDDLLHIAYDLEAGGQPVVGGAILSGLEAIKRTRVVASFPAEAGPFWDGLAQIRDGGALIIDLSQLATRAQAGLVHAVAHSMGTIGARESALSLNGVPCVFFDDAQLLVNRRLMTDVIVPMQQRGFTSFFVTEMVSGLDDTLLRQTDHLFIRQLASDAQASHLARSGLVDPETLRTVARRLSTHHSMLIGGVTAGYPIIFAVDPSYAVGMVGALPASLRVPAMAKAPSRTAAAALRHGSARVEEPAGGEQPLPLFPANTPTLALGPDDRDQLQPPRASPSSPVTLAQITAMWDHVVKRVSRRRRILETILSTARPLRLVRQTVVLGFSPQQRFQQELIESEEYRHLLEEELRKTFGMALEVSTELLPM
jgi:hypothetical protein